MTYSNPLLKHVKKIKDMASEIEVYNWKLVANLIIDQCNLLLETKKAKKRKKVKECDEVFRMKRLGVVTLYGHSFENAISVKQCRDLYKQLEYDLLAKKEAHSPDPKEENEEKVCNCRGNGNANNVDLPCSSCGGVNPMKFTPSRSEELEKIIRNWKTAEFYVDDTCEDEEVSELSKAILTKFTLTPIK